MSLVSAARERARIHLRQHQARERKWEAEAGHLRLAHHEAMRSPRSCTLQRQTRWCGAPRMTHGRRLRLEGGPVRTSELMATADASQIVNLANQRQSLAYAGNRDEDGPVGMAGRTERGVSKKGSERGVCNKQATARKMGEGPMRSQQSVPRCHSTCTQCSSSVPASALQVRRPAWLRADAAVCRPRKRR